MQAMRSEQKNKKGLSVYEMTQMALAVALIIICSYISIPFAVPFTMQTFAIFLTIALFGTKRATITIGVYILLGAIGLPVFSGMKGGLGALFGTTGGYIIGFLVMSLVAGSILHYWGNSVWKMLIAMSIGLMVLYLFGTAWFYFVYLRNTGAISIVTVLGWCVFPFVLPDIGKMVLGIVLGKRLAKYIQGR